LAGSLKPLQALTHHAIVAAQAHVSEARGEHEAAAAGFADVAARRGPRDLGAAWSETGAG
jgi:hypothetical protein